MSLIAARDLRAGHAGVEVVHGVDLDVTAGEVSLLLGPNGAGKTTTLLTLTGVLPAMGGTVEVLGTRVRGGASRRLVARGLAFVPEDRGLFRQLSVGENLRLRARRSRSALDDAVDHFPALAPLMGRRAGLLSGGEQQMLALACALALRPKVLVVDEMTLGLAPIVVAEILPIVQQVAAGGVGVLLVEQHVHAALKVADRCTVLQQGRTIRSGPAAELLAAPDLLASGYFGSP